MSAPNTHTPVNSRPIVIELPAALDYLVLVRHFICSLAHHMGFDQENVNKIELALDEACSNSVRAIQSREGSHPQTKLRLEIVAAENALEIIVIDNGACFTEHFERSVAMEELVRRCQTRGYGLQIIKTCMDEVQYMHLPEQGNRLVLRKVLQ